MEYSTTQLQTPMVKIWSMTLKAPGTLADGSAAETSRTAELNSLLQSVLDFCHSASGGSDYVHQFWEEDANVPRYLVLITCYPTLEMNLAADREYVARGFLPKMAESVHSGRLIMCMRDGRDLRGLLDKTEEGLEIEILDESQSRSEGTLGGSEGLIWDGIELVRGKEKGRVQMRFLMSKRVGYTSQGETVDHGHQKFYLRRRL